MARLGVALGGGGLSPTEIVDCVKLAEDLGYESAWVVEGHGGDQFSLLTACAVQTKKILLGTAISSVFVRSAPTIAMAAACVDYFSNQRFILGLGSSHKVQVEPEHGVAYAKPEDRLRYRAGADVQQRIRDAAADGVDAEIVFPNKGLLCFTTPDPVFQQAMFRAWNRWAQETFADHWERFIPMAMIAPGNLEGALAEVKWAAEQRFKGLTLPNKPIFGPPKPGELQYNDKHFDPLWSLIEEVDLPITFHVSTGRDPRGVTGLGGAVINYVCHSMPTVMEPLVNLISSGVFERHPQLRAGSIEGGIGWVPWMIEAMDYSFQAHHMWVRPVMPELPSFYYRRNCFSAFMEDHVTLPRAEELGIVENLMWSNDYPHHEGSWPHSAESIERQMGCLSETSRAKVLGLNAARVFKLKEPVKQ